MSYMNCPYCGEPEETDTPTGITIYRCGTLIYPNGSSVTPLICDLGRDLRREREAHNQTRRECDEAREKAVQWERIALRADTERAEAINQNAKLRDIAERAIEAIPFTEGYGEFSYAAAVLRAELDQIKEGAK